MDNHDWKKEYRKIDAYLASKYKTKPYTIHFIRVSSLRKNLAQKEIAFSVVRRMEQYKLDANGMQQHRAIFEFVSNLTHEEWNDITRPDTEAIEYMLKGATLVNTKKSK